MIYLSFGGKYARKVGMAKPGKKSKRKKEEVAAKPATGEVIADIEKSGTYGGIPQRDLKKNLGCG